MNRFYLLLLTMLTTVNSYAQEDGGANYFDLVPQIVSPQLKTMMRFDQSPTTLNSGKIDLTVPVINFVDPDFDFPITISYDSGGFIPSEGDSFVGRNWLLNMGGAIYRTVNGVVDDSDFTDYGGSVQLGTTLGFLNFAKNPNLWMNNDDVRTNFLSDPDVYTDYPPDHSYRLIKGTKIEASPDIFNFSFGRHSGKFMITYDGSVSVLSNSGGKYKVDISEFNTYSNANPTGINNSIIKITTDDGYIYSFGESYDAMEYMAYGWDSRYKTGTFGLARKTNQVTAFYLTKIVAPNGRILKLGYNNNVSEQYHKESVRLTYPENCDNLLSSKLNMNYSFAGKSFSICTFLVDHDQNLETNVAKIFKSYCINKIALVQSVELDDKSINFYYSPRQEASFIAPDDYCKFAAMCGAQLDSVVMRNSQGDIVERCHFQYQYRLKHLFLTQIKHSSMGNYAFAYKQIGNLPDMFTTNIDHWGYWRGNISNQRIIPVIGIKNHHYLDHKYSLESTDRDATGSEYDATLLTDVTYPTGGKVQFEYEPNDYCFAVNSSYAGTGWEGNIGNKIEIAGGARIKFLRHYDYVNGKFEKIKQIYYRYKQLDNELSSGTAEYIPRYACLKYNTSIHGIEWIDFFVIANSEGYNPASYSANHISYDRVVEQIGDIANLTADSTMRAYITPLDGVRRKTVFCQVGYLGNLASAIFPYHSREELFDIERNYSKWTISGSGYTDINAVSRLTIRNGGAIIKEYVFSNSNKAPITFNPVSELPKGTYTITLEADSMAFVSFQTDYPHTGGYQTTGSYKATEFIGHRANYDDYASIKSFFIARDTNKMLMFKGPMDLSFYQNFYGDPIRPLNRGKISSETYCNENNQMVRMVSYYYADKGKNNKVGYIRHNDIDTFDPTMKQSMIAQFVLKPFVTNHLVEKTVRDYNGEGSDMVLSQENYHYDEAGYLKGKSILNSQGDSIRTDYCYSNDMGGGVFEQMKDKNILSAIVEEKQNIVKGSASRELMRIKRYFAFMPGVEKPVISSVFQHIDGVSDERVMCLNYDKFGNPVYVINDQSKHTVYLWGYGGKYIVAKIDNASYAQVKSALMGVIPEDLSLQMTPDVDLLNSLRAKLLMSHITTYTYKPSIGMLSQTDPSGRVINYTYDESNRLIETSTVGLNGKEVLVKNSYHILNK